MASKTLTGARAKIYVNNALVGIFETCSYSSSYGTEPIHILGAFGPQEIVINSQEAVSLTCGGFRLAGQGPHLLPGVPKLADLLNFESVQLVIVDRQSGAKILTADGCVPNSYSGSHNARATSRISITYSGLRITDENSEGDSENGNSQLP
jgi:hypothetical protein